MNFDKLYKKHQSLIEHSENQAEELEILEKSFLDKVKPPKHIQKKSLQSELETLNDSVEITFPDSPVLFIKKSLAFDCVKSSFRAPSRNIGVFKQESMSAEAIRIRKPPGEEYFTLLTQAIKLNSPYMNIICALPPKCLYDEALKARVPFNKWQIWIEQQLNSAYLRNIYKKTGAIIKQSN